MTHTACSAGSVSCRVNDIPDKVWNQRCRRCGTWYKAEFYGNHTTLIEQLCPECYEGVRVYGWERGYTLPELHKE